MKKLIDLLREGDTFRATGQISEAVESYLAYCASIELPESANDLRTVLQGAGVRKMVLDLDPSLRSVRYALALNYISLGQIPEAQVELERVRSESKDLDDSALVDMAEMSQRLITVPRA